MSMLFLQNILDVTIRGSGGASNVLTKVSDGDCSVNSLDSYSN